MSSKLILINYMNTKFAKLNIVDQWLTLSFVEDWLASYMSPRG